MVINAQPGGTYIDSSLRLTDRDYAVVLIRLATLADDLRSKVSHLYPTEARYTTVERMQSTQSLDADYILQSTMNNLDGSFKIYRVIIPAQSTWDTNIRSGETVLPPFNTYPQVVLYHAGMPYRFMNGDLTDEDTVKRFLTDVTTYVYFG